MVAKMPFNFKSWRYNRKEMVPFQYQVLILPIGESPKICVESASCVDSSATRWLSLWNDRSCLDPNSRFSNVRNTIRYRDVSADLCSRYVAVCASDSRGVVLTGLF